VTIRPSFSAGQARVLFEGQYVTGAAPEGESTAYCVTPDGKHMILRKQSGTTSQIMVVLNWFEDLKRRVPSGA